jgi:succinate dehydrogenase hydrophobic anchor subunit
MKRNRVLRGLKFLVLALLAVTVFSLVVMALWNWLMPAVFGLHAVTFWQAVGLLALCKILFHGWPHGRGMHGRMRMWDRWQEMTPEERAKFRAGLHGGCGHFGASPEAPKA